MICLSTSFPSPPRRTASTFSTSASSRASVGRTVRFPGRRHRREAPQRRQKRWRRGSYAQLACRSGVPIFPVCDGMRRYEHCKWSQDTMNIPRRIGANKHCAGQSRDFTPIEVHGTFEYYYPVPVRRERRKKVNNGLTVDRARCIASRTRLGRRKRSKSGRFGHFEIFRECSEILRMFSRGTGECGEPVFRGGGAGGGELWPLALMGISPTSY